MGVDGCNVGVTEVKGMLGVADEGLETTVVEGKIRDDCDILVEQCCDSGAELLTAIRWPDASSLMRCNCTNL